MIDRYTRSLLLLTLLLIQSFSNFAQTVTFNFTGSVQSWTVPPCVTSINVIAAGARGGGNGGNGSVVSATLSVLPGQQLQIYVGGMGNCPSGGYNGGANGQNANTPTNGSCGGGGATDIRTAPYALTNRIIVAAGGGGKGGGTSGGTGGAGGCTIGTAGSSPFGGGGGAGTQTNGGNAGISWSGSGNSGVAGTLGNGGNGGTDPCFNRAPGGGGGGGYYGGGGGGSDCFNTGSVGGGGGGGGSSFAISGGTCLSNSNSGNGFLTITYTINPLIVSASNTGAYCSGATLQLYGSGTGTYNWTGPNGFTSTLQNPTLPNITTANAGVYTLSVNNNGCIGTASTTVVVNASPNLVTNGNQSICAGSQVTLIASGASTYSWTNGVFNNIAFSPAASNSYTVTATGSNGCTATATVNVTVNPLPLIQVSNQSICPGGSAILNASGASTYSWSPSSNLSSASGSSVNATPSSTTNYTITGTSTEGCTSQATATVTVFPGTVINAGADVSICAGQSTVLSANGGVSYSWDNGIGTVNNVSASPISTTTYTVIGTDANGCIGTDDIIVTVNPLPTIALDPDYSVCEGMSTTLTANGASTYQWNNGVNNGVSFTPTSTSTYTVIGTSSQGCINSNSITITVHPLPIISAGANQTVCAGTAVTLSASGGIHYTWNNNVINAVAFTPSSSTTYTVTGTNSNGCTNTSQTTVTVNPVPAVNAGSNQTVCAGSQVTLTASGASSYSWSNGVTNGVPFVPSSTTTYTVIGTNSNGCTGQSQVTVTVNANPIISAGNNATVCAGNTVTLNANGGVSYSWSNGVVNNVPFVPTNTSIYSVIGTAANGCTGSSQVSVTVNPLPNIIAGNTQTICSGTPITLSATGGTAYNWNNGVNNGVAFTPTGTNTYTVTGTGSNGCTNTASVLVVVNSAPNVNAGQNQSICAGFPVTLSASGANTYSWNNGVLNNSAFYPTTTNTYTVTGTSVNGCTATSQVTVTVNPSPTVNGGSNKVVCAGTAIILNATGANTYTWSNGVMNNVPFVPINSGTYTVTGTSSNGCIGTSSVFVTVNPLPIINAGPDISVCNGSAVQLNASGGVSYLWSNGLNNGSSFVPSSTAVYSVTGTDHNGCIATDDIQVVVNPIPTVFAGADQNICDGNSVTLNAQGANTYSWSSGLINGVSFNLPVGQYAYTVTGTSAAGCSATDEITITVIPKPIVNFDSDINTGCSPLQVTFTNTSPESQSCQWNMHDGTSLISGNTVSHKFMNFGDYTVSLTILGSNGCSNTLSLENYIHVLETPKASFFSNSAVITESNGKINFFNTSTGADKYLWSFGDESVGSIEFSPSHSYVYQSYGQYLVTLIAYNDNGCVDSISKWIRAQEEEIFYIPNAFTPNGNGLNDVFKPIFTSGYDEHNFYFAVYNRWGELIFETKDPELGWNGTSMKSGDLVGEGIYTYMVIFKSSINSERKQIMGHVNLMK